ncbi:hypothetical protein AAG906_020204 [Vitis piasezkii]
MEPIAPPVLKISWVNRHSQGQDGRPFLIKIDAAWVLEEDAPSARIVEIWVIGSKSSNSNRNKSFSAANQVSEADEGKPAVALSEAQLKQLLSLLNNQDENSSSKVNAVTKPSLSKVFPYWCILRDRYEEDDWFGHPSFHRNTLTQTNHSAPSLRCHIARQSSSTIMFAPTFPPINRLS